MLRRVLIVDGDARQARAMAAALGGAELLLRVETALPDALECVASWKPECVVADMAGAGGLDPGLGGLDPGLGGPVPGLGGPVPGLGGLDPGLGGPVPGLGGLELCRRLKREPRTSSIAVMLLLAAREQAAINRAFAEGADDTMVKPCHPVELLWRVRGLLRRYDGPVTRPEALRLGPFELSVEQGLARLEGKELRLTKTELLLLELLVRNPTRVLSRRFLLDNIWGYNRLVRTRVVDLCVFQLRKKLGPKWGRCVETHRSFGYRLNPQASPTRKRANV